MISIEFVPEINNFHNFPGPRCIIRFIVGLGGGGGGRDRRFLGGRTTPVRRTRDTRSWPRCVFRRNRRQGLFLK